MRRLFLALLPLLAAMSPSQAQRFGGGGGGDFDFYVLSLSWSPSYCETTGFDRGSRQCDRGANPGFVLHGLWPQYERGYPRNCGADRNLPRYILDEMRGVFPEDGLARHEWRTHGTCSGLGPREYMRAAAEAKAKVRIPEELAAPRHEQRLRLMEIERAFSAANPGLRPDMIAVTCKRGMIEDVRICMTKDLRAFRPCEEVNRQQCRSADVMVPVSR
ncbi:MAG: ribonuclease T2 [Proteobacteria bacterium]|nr:ribonuclease T2 [Pseudomonadota bacterium]